MKKWVFSFIIVCFAGLCTCLFFAFYNTAKESAIRQLNEQQLIHAKQAVQGIGDFFKTWEGILDSLSKLEEIVTVDKDGKRYMALLQEAHHDQIRSITRVDERGRILYTVPYSNSVGSDISGQEHMREILREHKPVVSDVFRTVQGFYGVALHLPVFKGTVFKGTIAVVLDFEHLAKRYLDVIKIGKTGYAWVIGRDGTTLYSPIPGFTGKSVFVNCKDFPALLSMAREMQQGHKGTVTYTFDRIADQTAAPMKKYAVYMPVRIGNSFWSIAVASAEEEAFSSLESFRNRLFLIIAMILSGGVLFSALGAKAWLIVAEEKTRRMAEEKLRESEQYNRLLFEQSPIGLVLASMDGKLVDINSAFAGIIGRTIDEALNVTYWDITPEKYAFQEQQQLESLNSSGAYGPYEKEYIHKDGHLVPVRLQGLLIDRTGEKFIWSSVEDISERKKSVDALRNSEEKFLKAFHATPDAIIISRLSDGHILEYNEVFLQQSGYSPAEVLDRSTVELNLWVDQYDRELFVAGIRAQGKVREMESRFRAKSGAVLDGLVSGESIELNGQPCLLTIIRNITERKQAEQELEKHRDDLEKLVKERTEKFEEKAAQLERSQTAMQHLLENVNEANKKLEEANEKLHEVDRLKSMFIASMSHELRTQLNSVIGFSSILLNEWLGTLKDEQKKSLASILRSGKHLLSVINDVIDVSKIETGMIEVNREEFALNDLLAEVEQTCAKEAQDRKLSLDVEQINRVMHTDRRRLLQCLLNLVSNAIKFTEQGGVTVSVRFDEEKGTISLTVTDTGIGIDTADQARLFQPFSRIQSHLSATVPGTGLGLYLTRKIVGDILQGEISISSEPGSGSSFSMTIPARIEEIAKADS